MATIPCDEKQMSKAYCKFTREMGNKNNSQESIKGLHKGLTLHYLGLQDVDEVTIEKWAMFLEIATNGALQRGWEL